MKTIGLSLFLCIILNFSLIAKVWVVNSNVGGPGDFKTAQTAIDAAASGDTLYFVGSTISYNSPILTKRLTLIGAGYFLNENPNTYVNKSTANFGFIDLKKSDVDIENPNSGAAGSVLIGLEAGTVGIRVNNVEILRSKIGDIQNNSGGNTTGLVVKQCFLGSVSSTAQYPFSNCFFINNIVYSSGSISAFNSLYKNNTFVTNYGGDGSNEYVNNIFNDYTTITFNFNMDPNNLRNNIFGGKNTANDSRYTDGINNIFDVFGNIILSSGTTDGKYQLKEGSVASGAGEDGVDCGAFGGSEPYILSGLPPIPVIYEINVPTSVNKADGLEIQIKAKVQN